jgi:hypothetical protein
MRIVEVVMALKRRIEKKRESVVRAVGGIKKLVAAHMEVDKSRRRSLCQLLSSTG